MLLRENCPKISAENVREHIYMRDGGKNGKQRK